ncbi:MAG: hypothetical protein WC527_00980 [Candidatus Margulisiibacteriota bacterium]
MRKILLLPAFILILVLFAVQNYAYADSDISSSLKTIGDTVLKTFRSLDLYLDLSSKKISEKSVDSFNQQAMSGKTFVTQANTTGIDPFTINPILDEVRTSVPYVFDVAYVNRNGIIRAVQPPVPGVMGTDISGQEQFQRVRDTKMPALSREFLAIEGFYAVAFQHPILTYDGLFLGATSLLIRPQTLLRSIIDNETRGVSVDVWVMQPDGKIIYDKDDEEIGRNFFTDDLYKPFKGLLDLGKKIATIESGVSKYDFYAIGTDKVVTKNASWITLDVYGTQWKIVATTSIDKTLSPDRTLCQLGIETIGDALVGLSKNDLLLKAVSKGDDDSVKGLFENFYAKYPCYSIQWVDKDLVNRGGVPADHTLLNYKFDPNHSQDLDFVNAVNSRKETVFESTLFEGGTGKFHLVPLFKGNDYLGTIYSIRIEP